MNIRGFAIVAAVLACTVGRPAAFPFDSIFVMDGNVLAVEAEECYAGEYWVFDQEHSGYTGGGYMRYTGPEAICLDPGETDRDSPTDEDNRCQGDPRARLRIPVRITRRGLYNINARCYAETDGVGPGSHASGKDHTAWIMVEELLDTDRAGSGHTEAGAKHRWTWFSFGPGSNQHPDCQVGYALEPGDYVFYLGGRHRNFRADRVHIYPKTGPASYPPEDTVATIATALKMLYQAPTAASMAPSNRRAPRTAGREAQRYHLNGRTADTKHSISRRSTGLRAVYLIRFDSGISLLSAQ